MSMCSKIRITMNIRIVDELKGTVYLPTEVYTCDVQPAPHCYHRPQVLAIQAEALAKIKYINAMYSRIANERDIRHRLQGKKWTVEAIVIEQKMLEDEVVLG